MSPRPHDTTPAAWSAYQGILGQMDGPARLGAAIELSDAVREIRLAGLEAQCPELSAEERVARLVLEEYGIALSGAR